MSHDAARGTRGCLLGDGVSADVPASPGTQLSWRRSFISTPHLRRAAASSCSVLSAICAPCTSCCQVANSHATMSADVVLLALNKLVKLYMQEQQQQQQQQQAEQQEPKQAEQLLQQTLPQLLARFSR